MGLSIWHLLVVLAIALVIFGSRKLRNLGGDLGGAIRNFKSAVKEGEEDQGETAQEETPSNEKVTKLEKKAAPRVIEGKATATRSRKKKA
jgi:sec-independent protein translocase protein TatA